jgi:hypothetical protein
MPGGPIDVFAGQDLVVLARYEGEGEATVRLEGRAPSGPVTWSTRVNFRERERANPFVARLWAAQRIGWLAAEKRRNGGSTELNNEIRTLGERFGIPTEYSSYLVLEPGMVPCTPNVPCAMPTANQLPRVERGQVGAQSVTTGSTRGSGVGTGSGTAGGSAAGATPPPVATAPAADARFEAARASAEQRSAKSIGSLDASLSDGSNRVIGNRRFVLSNGVWRDVRFTATMKQIRVKPFSPLYFDLMQRIEELTQPFALGDRVIVAGRAVAITLESDGLEKMDEPQLQAVIRDWK